MCGGREQRRVILVPKKVEIRVQFPARVDRNGDQRSARGGRDSCELVDRTRKCFQVVVGIEVDAVEDDEIENEFGVSSRKRQPVAPQCRQRVNTARQKRGGAAASAGWFRKRRRLNSDGGGAVPFAKCSEDRLQATLQPRANGCLDENAFLPSLNGWKHRRS